MPGTAMSGKVLGLVTALFVTKVNVEARMTGWEQRIGHGSQLCMALVEGDDLAFIVRQDVDGPVDLAIRAAGHKRVAGEGVLRSPLARGDVGEVLHLRVAVRGLHLAARDDPVDVQRQVAVVLQGHHNAAVGLACTLTPPRGEHSAGLVASVVPAHWAIVHEDGGVVASLQGGHALVESLGALIKAELPGLQVRRMHFAPGVVHLDGPRLVKVAVDMENA
mmetsp:Transcript_2359/g.6854  ORF Transcript_2359/g.6854 Transcript_2359/m.6854 type:complete len:220 (-) Transcript_2359:908-1567(-)